MQHNVARTPLPASTAGRVWVQTSELMRGKSNAAALLQTMCVRFVLLGVNFGTGIIVARSLGPLGRGEQAAITLWSGLLGALATFGIPTALRYHTRRKPDDGARYYAAAFLMLFGIGLVAMLVGVSLMPLFLHGYDEAVIRSAREFMVFTPQVLLICIVGAYFESRGEFRRAILMQLYPNLATLAVLVGLRLIGHITPISAALSYAVPALLQLLWLSALMWPRSIRHIRDLISPARTLLDYGVRSYGADIIGALSGQLDLAVIVTFLTPTDLGLYTMALTLSRLLSVVQTSVVAVVFPRASSLDYDASIALVIRAARFSTLLSVVFGTFFLLITPFALPRLYGADFSAAVRLMPLLTAESIVGGTCWVLCQSFLANARPFVVTLIQSGSIVCVLALLLVLVPRMQTLGAATALLCTSAIRLAVIMGAYRVVLQRPVPRLWIDAADIAYVRSRLFKSSSGYAPRMAEES
jgi:O-antigen/teichoic acid export membrane protein